MKTQPCLLAAIFIILFSACAKKEIPPFPYSYIKDEQVKTILEKSIARSGGYEKFQNIDSIFYKKRTVLFDSLGNVESDVVQFHQYQLKPYLAMSIIWEKDGEEHEIIYKEDKAKKLVNKKLVEADEAALVRTCMSAHYVLFMPFKLLDPGVGLTYGGETKLPNGEEVHIIAAEYDPGENENHSTNDDWEYYFDKNNYDFVANMVDHGDYFAMIYNDKYAEAGGLRFNAYRPSFRVNAERAHLWRRGDFYYSDFRVK